jgi:hypothetical protein
METGEIEVLYPLAVYPAVGGFNLEPDFVTIQLRLMEEQLVQDKAQRIQPAMFSNVLLVEKHICL